MKTSLFSQSLIAVNLKEAICVAAEVGYDAIELGCFAPHLTREMADTRGDEVCLWLAEAGLPVSALSLSVEYTSENEEVWHANVDETSRMIRLCAKFGASILKTMPGRPGSAHATEKHWDQYRRAMDLIMPIAQAQGVKLALETHLNHLSDSIETAARCLESGPPELLGVNLDFCNVRTCHEDPLEAIDRFQGRIFFSHVKDSLFNTQSGEYVPLGQGKMDYRPIIERLRAIGYEGYLSVECLYVPAKEHAPKRSVAQDLRYLTGLLERPVHASPGDKEEGNSGQPSAPPGVASWEKH